MKFKVENSDTSDEELNTLCYILDTFLMGTNTYMASFVSMEKVSCSSSSGVAH